MSQSRDHTITKENMIDGDAFERLARELNLVYISTHDLKDRVDTLRSQPGVVNVLSANSDGCIIPKGMESRWHDFVWDAMPSNVNHWFAQNAHVGDARLTPIPIGLECDRWHPPSEKKDTILSILSGPVAPREHLVYLNHTERTPLRFDIYKWFSDASWCTSEPRSDFSHYAQQLSVHKFVFSPDGNGFDCCRTWEALYLGSFPIVERHYFTEEFAKCLPLLIVDDFSSITEGFLDDKYTEFTNREWNWAALGTQYWRDLMKEKCDG
jgi:hypothetical protein